MTNKASILYALALALYLLPYFASSQSMPSNVIDYLASREQRHHHFLWHNIRENWNRMSSSTQDEIRDRGWAPPRPGRRFSNGEPVAISDNNSGEDFLYMHRQMVRRVRSMGLNVRGWTTLPGPDDRNWPVPSPYSIPGESSRTSTVNNWKTARFYNNEIRSTERTLTDPARLRRMTLGEYGSRIEVTLHQYYHLRYSARSSYGYRPTTSAAFPNIDERWDNPAYNWLVDSYSSHVNPIFWEIHAWVDERVEDWRRANGLSSIRWNGRWQGGPMSRVSDLWDKKQSTSFRGSGHGARMADGDNLIQEIVQILFKEGLQEVSLADPVFLDVPLKVRSKKRLCKANLVKKRRL